jgi:hypothetical protein
VAGEGLVRMEVAERQPELHCQCEERQQ